MVEMLQMYWLAVVWSKEVALLYVFRFLAGLVGGGAYLSVPLLVAEISESQ